MSALAEATRTAVFISYRREDTAHPAGRLADRVAERFPGARVFMDVDSIPPGVDFVRAVEQAIGDCDVLLALIGPRWTTLADATGRRRLDDPEDFVVLELRAALDRDIPVIPVLLDGAAMPSRAELAPHLGRLTRRNAVRIDADTFRHDTGWLLERLAEILPPEGEERRVRRVTRRDALRLAGGAAVASATGAGAWALTRPHGREPVRPRWSVRTGGEVYSSPALAGGVVFVGSNDRHLYALRAGSGDRVWRYPAADGFTSSPAVSGGAVFVGCNDGALHSVDAATGRRRWTFQTGGAIHSSPAVSGGVVYVGSRDDHLYAVDALSGRERWRFRGGDWFNSSPTVADGAVFAGCRDHEVYALDAATGAKRWSYTTESTVDSSAAVRGTTLWIGSDDHTVYALDARTGRWIWGFAAGGGVVSTPLPAGGVLYVGSDDGHLYAIDADTGRERWRHATANGIRSSPAIARGVVYVGSRDFSVYALDAATGRRRWRFRTGAPVDDSSPLVSGATVYVGSLDGRVYALPAAA